MLIQKENTIGEVVVGNFHTAKIFERYGIDFCCGGKKSIEDACRDKGLDSVMVLEDLEKMNQSNATSTRFNTWDVDFLAEYIVNNHHSYVISAISTIEHHLHKVLSAHGEKHPEIAGIESIFTELKNELLDHLAKEEKMLFPYIKKMNFALKNTLELPIPPFGTVENPIKVMELEHDNAGMLTKSINSLSNGYQPPKDACATFRVLYNELKEFEEDLHVHIHLENNILYPKAKELEEKLKKTFSVL